MSLIHSRSVCLLVPSALCHRLSSILRSSTPNDLLFTFFFYFFFLCPHITGNSGGNSVWQVQHRASDRIYLLSNAFNVMLCLVIAVRLSNRMKCPPSTRQLKNIYSPLKVLSPGNCLAQLNICGPVSLYYYIFFFLPYKLHNSNNKIDNS